VELRGELLLAQQLRDAAGGGDVARREEARDVVSISSLSPDAAMS
jgi:hypothetical protein